MQTSVGNANRSVKIIDAEDSTYKKTNSQMIWTDVRHTRNEKTSKDTHRASQTSSTLMQKSAAALVPECAHKA